MTFKQFTEDIDTWTLAQAQKIVKQITPHFAKHGYTIKIVGGVAKKGFSYSDLDLLIKRTRKDATELSDVLGIFDKKPFSGWDESGGTIVTYGNREIDLYYPGIPLYNEEESDTFHTKGSNQEFAKLCQYLQSKGYQLEVQPDTHASYHMTINKKPTKLPGWKFEGREKGLDCWFKPSVGELKIARFGQKLPKYW